MTHLVRGISTYKSKKKKLSKTQLLIRENHNNWLKSNGVHPDQLTERLKNRKQSIEREQIIEDRKLPPMSNTVGNGLKNDIWEKIRKGIETVDTVNEIKAKSKRIAPAFNKGGYQYITPGMDLKDLGKKK